ncbi:hypothetical protein L3Y34_005468 [Caenorhabditis briggsae]|uniref:Uncharacterized protein n=1 Tax=Caenorhabditis briggsae TaxID=6238 RepID=A0AAE9D795_CAEBR|nr:hypothetical protein L3Y34_005468 [Caenorhabditis briggsae]
MILCCCWPLGKCAKVLAAFDFLIVGFFFIKSCEMLMETANDLHWTTIVSFFFFLGFIICQALGLFFIVLAAKKKCARYCLPRLVLIAGLTVCSLIVLIFMLTYFAGSAQSVNNFLFKVYEYFFGTVLTDAERVELKHELRYYGAAFFVLAALFFIYKKFWKNKIFGVVRSVDILLMNRIEIGLVGIYVFSRFTFFFGFLDF